MIKGIIFDFDGVLVHSENANIQAAIKTFKDLGLPLSDEERMAIPGASSQDFLPKFLNKRGIVDPTEHHRFYLINKDNYTSIWKDTVSIYPSVKSTIKTLGLQDKVLGIATSNLPETVQKFFDHFDMHDMFSFVVTGKDVTKRKPDPEIYALAVEKSGLTREELIAVEDTDVGLTSAKGAGLRCAVIPNEFTLDHDFSKADFVLTSIEELLKIN